MLIVNAKCTGNAAERHDDEPNCRNGADRSILALSSNVNAINYVAAAAAGCNWSVPVLPEHRETG